MPEAGLAAKLHQEFGIYETRLQRLNRVRWILRIVLMLVSLTLITAIIYRFKTVFREETFQPALQEEMLRISPALGQTAQEALADVAPAYLELGSEKITAALPALQAAVQKEQALFTQNIGQLADQELHHIVSLITQKQLENLSQVIPEFGTEEGRQAIRLEWQNGIEEELNNIIYPFIGEYIKDVLRLKRRLEDFYPNRFAAYSLPDLQRHFARLWLKLLDYYIVQSGKEGAPPHE